MQSKFLHKHLTDDPVIAALVATRVYPRKLPQNVLRPAISFEQISGPRSMNLVGPDHLANPRWQISCWDSTEEGSGALVELVRKSLEGLRGSLGGLVVYGIFVIDERGLFESESKLYRSDLDVLIWHPE